ncbi:MAG: hypothetical protein PHQ52_08370, partial [Candidatus Omnitrophica bacterium]|nr:hypothetical protein [Candidatus Omnitrophota bacterium]
MKICSKTIKIFISILAISFFPSVNIHAQDVTFKESNLAIVSPFSDLDISSKLSQQEVSSKYVSSCIAHILEA